METYSKTTENPKYREALKKERRIKGFYIHATVYVCVNLFIILGGMYKNEKNLVVMDTYSTAFFWGIGLLAHGLTVFGADWVFGKGWEERKIQQYLEK